MKIKKGVPEYQLAERIGIMNTVVYVCNDGHFFPLMQVNYTDYKFFQEKNTGVLGVPTYFCHMAGVGVDTIGLFPAPDVDGEVIVRYWPCLKEQ